MIDLLRSQMTCARCGAVRAATGRPTADDPWRLPEGWATVMVKIVGQTARFTHYCEACAPAILECLVAAAPREP